MELKKLQPGVWKNLEGNLTDWRNKRVKETHKYFFFFIKLHESCGYHNLKIQIWVCYCASKHITLIYCCVHIHWVKIYYYSFIVHHCSYYLQCILYIHYITLHCILYYIYKYYLQIIIYDFYLKYTNGENKASIIVFVPAFICNLPHRRLCEECKAHNPVWMSQCITVDQKKTSDWYCRYWICSKFGAAWRHSTLKFLNKLKCFPYLILHYISVCHWSNSLRFCVIL